LEENHLMANGYANSWWVNLDDIKNSGKYVENPDGSIDFELVIEFWPQRLFYLGLAISGLTLFGCLFYLYWISRRKINKLLKSLTNPNDWRERGKTAKAEARRIAASIKSFKFEDLKKILKKGINVKRLKIKNLKIKKLANNFSKLFRAGFIKIFKQTAKIKNDAHLQSSKKSLELEKEKVALEKEKLGLEKDRLSVVPPIVSESKNFDENILTGSAINDINLKFASNKKSEIEQRFGKTFSNVEKLLQEIGCLTAENIPIRAGILLFGKDPQKYFKNSYLTFIKYDRNYNQEENVNFKGNLIEIIEDSFKAIKGFIPVKEVISDDTATRKKVPDFPYIAIREFLINAVVHRDYSVSGSRVIISMYEDRIEFQSPGGLPNNITPETILRSQYSRNSTIAETLYYLGYIEQLGSGMDRVFQIFKDLNKKPPKIEDFGNMVIVTIYKK
jgi:ATP-dependent DNA helicase RecG